jgi:hypothetical protein
MAGRTPIYSTKVGISYLMTADTVLNGLEAFVTELMKPYPALALEKHYQASRTLSSASVIRSYEKTFESLLMAYRRNPTAIRSELPDFSWW